MKNRFLLILIIASASQNVNSQCSPSLPNIYSFTTNGTPYEIIKENLNWVDASACAVTRGGKLAEIDSQTENDSIFYYMNLSGITASNTDAPDGGGASYLWIGGNDLTTEGNWVWNGDNDGTSAQFWLGTSSGSPVGGLYNNWGNEPDNFSEQDALGFAFTNWPFGVAGEWNDIDETNLLHYIIEYPNTSSVGENKSTSISIYPNPTFDFINVKISTEMIGAVYTLTDQTGRIVLTGTFNSEKSTIDLSNLASGIYLLNCSALKQEPIRVIKN